MRKAILIRLSFLETKRGWLCRKKDDYMKQILVKRLDETEFLFYLPERKEEDEAALELDLQLCEDDLNAVPLEVWKEWRRIKLEGLSQVEIIEQILHGSGKNDQYPPPDEVWEPITLDDNKE